MMTYLVCSNVIYPSDRIQGHDRVQQNAVNAISIFIVHEVECFFILPCKSVHTPWFSTIGKEKESREVQWATLSHA